MTDPLASLDRNIWIYWNRGLANAPDVVRVCLRSWKLRNPGWRVVELSDENLAEHVDEVTLQRLRSLDNVTIQKFANLLRFYVISAHGGVWADATCFCSKPLDAWLGDYMPSGFFAFRRWPDKWLRESRNRPLEYARRTGDRIFANWFLASVRGNQLASKCFEKHLELFTINRYSLQRTRKGYRRMRRLERLLNRNARLASLWSHPAVVRTAKVYPYFIMHYHFARLVTTDEVCREIWEKTPVYLVGAVTKLLRSVISPMTETVMRDIQNPEIPMHKLTWKYDPDEFREGCVLDYLARSLD